MSKNSKTSNLTDYEKDLLSALKQANGNKTEAAKNLGMARTTFRDKLAKINNGSIKEKDNTAKLIENALAKAQGNKTKAAELLNMPKSTFFDSLKRVESEIEGFYRVIPKKQIYVITAAQNATPINENFFNTLKIYCEFNDAELIIIPIRYKNPTSIWSLVDEINESWDEKLHPYLCDVRSDLNKNLTVFADIKIQPTAVNPLSGFDALGRDKSVILGHSKLMLKTVPVPSHATPKILATTGCVTISNYTESKAGKKGDFHHTNAALVVEIDDDMFHMRQLNSTDDGSFIDLENEYTTEGVFEAERAAALVMGDVHAQFVDPDVLKATFEDENSIVNTLNPEYLVWHDVLDFYSRNHHHIGNAFTNYAKHKAGIDDVMKELEMTFNLINKYSKGRKNLFPYSNHPDAFARWIKEGDWKNDPVNAEIYLETALYMVKNTIMGESGTITPDPFAYWGRKLIDDDESAIFLHRDEPFFIHGISVGDHGDCGANGARGSVQGFSKLGVKTITAHGHSAEIFHGAHRVGTSTRYRLEYNKGPSSWLQTHCIIYANGKRSLINIIKGKHRR